MLQLIKRRDSAGVRKMLTAFCAIKCRHELSFFLSFKLSKINFVRKFSFFFDTIFLFSVAKKRNLVTASAQHKIALRSKFGLSLACCIFHGAFNAVRVNRLEFQTCVHNVWAMYVGTHYSLLQNRFIPKLTNRIGRILRECIQI